MAVRQSVVKVYSCFADGMAGTLSEIEVSLSPGIPTFDVIGLCDSSIRESRGRIRAALISAGFTMPKGHITVSISPAYMRKSGSAFDLPIAIGMLLASKQLPAPLNAKIYSEGELSLKGEIKGTPGSALRLKAAAGADYSMVIIPEEERVAAASVGLHGMTVTHLSNLDNIFIYKEYVCEEFRNEHDDAEDAPDDESIDIAVLKGQEKAARAVLLTAAGRHNLLMLGAPGCGKSLAGKIVKGLLPPLTQDEWSDVYSIYESAGLFDQQDLRSVKRPFRCLSPGITVSKLIGGGKPLKPGELALSNNGVLFADEICEYGNDVIDSLRIPLEEHSVRIDRDGVSYIFPASFIFVGAGNPCRCGMLYEGKCKCSPMARRRYAMKLSGPFLDRIDLFCEMRNVRTEDLEAIALPEEMKESPALRSRVAEAWAMQRERYSGLGKGIYNSNMDSDSPAEIMRADSSVIKAAAGAAGMSGFSARGFLRLIRVGRTVADLDGRQDMKPSDISEASLFRDSHFINV